MYRLTPPSKLLRFKCIWGNINSGALYPCMRYSKKSQLAIFPPILDDVSNEEHTVMETFKPAPTTSLEKVWRVLEREYTANERNVAESKYESSLKRLTQYAAKAPYKRADMEPMSITTIVGDICGAREQEAKPKKIVKVMTPQEITQRIVKLLEDGKERFNETKNISYRKKTIEKRTQSKKTSFVDYKPQK